MEDTCLIELSRIIPKEKIFLNEPMKKHTSFKIGGPAEIFIKVSTIKELKCAVEVAKGYNLPIHIIGNGSNLLVNDNGVKGIVIKSDFKNINMQENNDYIEVKVGSGVLLSTLAHNLLKREITGFEFAAGIPGTIGGAIRMNAGAHGGEMKDIVISTTYMDMEGNLHTISNKEHEFKYRNSIFEKNKYIIIETGLKLHYGNVEKIKKVMLENEKWRKENQPLEYPSAGSTFKRGKDFITAELIDKCGLRGYKIGGAQVSEKHTGFIINTGNATASDVIKLIEHVKKAVYEKFGKSIELELELI